MLAEIYKFNNLGTFEQIIYILNSILGEKSKKYYDIEIFCLHSTEFDRFPVQGVLSFLSYIHAIFYNDSYIFLTDEGIELVKKIKSGTDIRSIIVEMLINKVSESKEYLHLLKNTNLIKFDDLYSTYVVKNNYIPIRYSNIKNLLINLGFFYFEEANKNHLILNCEYINKVKKIMKQMRSKISIEEFKEIQERKDFYGEQAEIFIISYEKNRLVGHQNVDKIERISEIDVGAGYDIISFESKHSEILDIYIEVKSFWENIGFFWSKNEIQAAKEKGESYYLYLVDRKELDQKSYKPHIIRNPYKQVFCDNKWKREVENWYFTQLTD